MRKIGYSAGVKAVVTLFQEICAVILVISIILVSTLFDRSMLDLSDAGNKTFVNSSYYTKLVYEAVEDVYRYIQYQGQFETDGEYNPEKIVNILAYESANSNEAGNRTWFTGDNEFRYYLVDLENWSKEYTSQPCRVESSLYITQDGSIHQKQTVYVSGATVRESDVVVETLADMDQSLQEHIVAEAQYYYGGNYNLEEYQTASSLNNMTVFSDAAVSVTENAVEGQPKTDGAAEAGSDDAAGGTEEAASEEIQEDQEEAFSEIVQKIREGELFELSKEDLVLVLQDLGQTDALVVSAADIIEEIYLTVDGSTILEQFLSENITLREMQQMYQSLEYTLTTIGGEITEYKRMVNRYQSDRSNVKFWVYEEGDGERYTNMTQQETQEDLASYGKKLGSYFYYNKNDIRLDTNVKGLENIFYDTYESMNSGHNSVVFIGIDTEFPHEDSFYEAQEEYNSLQPWVIVSIVAAIVSGLGCLLTFIYLSLAAGRRGEDQEIHLLWIDRIKVEIFIIGFGLVCLGILFMGNELAWLFAESDMIGMMIMSGGMVFVGVAIFMMFYLSFVRRIKAGVMWRGSLIYWFGSGIQKLIQNWRPSVKILIFFGGHVLITLMLAFMAFFGGYRILVYVGFVFYLLLCVAEAVLFLREGIQRNMIIRGIKQIAGGDLEYEIDTIQLKGDNKIMGEAINTIGEGLYHAVDNSMKNERLKADLITNVSHDIKTPLTSIINYVDLLKREKLNNERVNGYINVLDSKSQRLKQLTEDLVEASKVSSGNIKLQMERLNFVELVYQTAGEFNEKFEARGLTAVTKLPREPVTILADGRRIWRVIENLYNNVAKYAMENTRVYVDMEIVESTAEFSIKNISEQALNIDASELTERFIRGDVSRSTEGSGLGLSIAKNLTELMGGTFDIYLDGDLFKVTVAFPIAQEKDYEKQA